MKVIIAPDKFKGSLTGMEFCNAVERGIRAFNTTAEILKLPLADGGDGTIDVIQYYTGGKTVNVEVLNPLMKPINASYLYSVKDKIAFIEMAEASGIRLLKKEDLNPLETSTYGTGQLIAHAITLGATRIILGIGGSSTNDAGLGMARALGYKFYDIDGVELLGKGKDLIHLHCIDSSNKNRHLEEVVIEVACDVDNPLYGPNGAAYIYAPQKGANEQQVQVLDQGLKNFNAVIMQNHQTNLHKIKGAGAAGGLGAASIFFLNATLQSGISLVKSIAQFDQKIQNTDWIISGEGKFDEQTFSGKVIKGIIDSISHQRLVILCGICELEENSPSLKQVEYIDQIMNYASDFDDSIAHAKQYLEMASMAFAKSKM